MHVQLVKRGIISKVETITIKVIAVLLAITVIGVYLAILGYNPFAVFASLVKGAFLSVKN